MTTPTQKKLVQKRLADIRGAKSMRFKRYKWTAFSDKTLWEWVQLLVQIIGTFAIPISIIALLVTVNQFNLQQKNDLERAIDQQQQSTLETYLDRMTDLLFTDKLGQSKRGDEVRGVARARTLTALQNLNPARKAILIKFLY